MSEAGSGGTQLDDDLSFQRRQWRAERIAWVAGTVILVLALAGFTGRGPASSTQRSDSAGTLEVSYDRIERRQSPSTVEITVANPEGASEMVALVSGHLIDGAEITRIVPEPASMISRGPTLEIAFDVSAESDQVRVAFTIEHQAIGRESSAIGLVDGPQVTIDQWVLP